MFVTHPPTQPTKPPTNQPTHPTSHWPCSASLEDDKDDEDENVDDVDDDYNYDDDDDKGTPKTRFEIKRMLDVQGTWVRSDFSFSSISQNILNWMK